MHKENSISIIDRYGIRLRPVDINDAEFIIKLRNNVAINKHISPTSDKLSDQIEWIKGYKEREKKGLEYYFLTEVNGERFGTTRLSELNNEIFELGSWVFSKESPSGVSIKADILTKEVGFDYLGFEFCKFNVRKANTNVLKYHLHYNPIIVDEDELNIYFNLSKTSFNINKTRFLKLL